MREREREWSFCWCVQVFCVLPLSVLLLFLPVLYICDWLACQIIQLFGKYLCKSLCQQERSQCCVSLPHWLDRSRKSGKLWPKCWATESMVIYGTLKILPMRTSRTYHSVQRKLLEEAHRNILKSPPGSIMACVFIKNSLHIQIMMYLKQISLWKYSRRHWILMDELWGKAEVRDFSRSLPHHLGGCGSVFQIDPAAAREMERHSP